MPLYFLFFFRSHGIKITTRVMIAAAIKTASTIPNAPIPSSLSAGAVVVGSVVTGGGVVAGVVTAGVVAAVAGTVVTSVAGGVVAAVVTVVTTPSSSPTFPLLGAGTASAVTEVNVKSATIRKKGNNFFFILYSSDSICCPFSMSTPLPFYQKAT